jgi:hypothetical protein
MTGRPAPTEAAEYFFRYIDQVSLEPGQDISAYLHAQLDDVLDMATGVDEARAGHRYAPEKWSLRQVIGHVSDTERVFAYRMFWFARGFEGPLPNFDENASADRAGKTSSTDITTAAPLPRGSHSIGSVFFVVICRCSQ